MSESEKKAECERICGEAGKRDVHSVAPVICPLELDRWKMGRKARV